MKNSIFIGKHPPWPDETEEALAARDDKMRRCRAAAGYGSPSSGATKSVVKWAVRAVIVSVTIWLLVQTAIT